MWTNNCSISSTCLILIETRTEFTDGSIKISSFSFLAITMGFKINSGVWLGSTSISGRLCLSTNWDEKSSRQIAAVSDARTAVKYGFNDCDYWLVLVQ